MSAAHRSGRVLVVDDEEAVADLYESWLVADYDVVTVYDGDRALELVDETIDVVLLDRQMAGCSGDEVLDVVTERELDCRVVMVTAVDPGFDIVEMPFDDYLTKPATRDELTEVVDEMFRREAYDEQIQEYFALVSKKATLEARKSDAELAESEAYADLTERVESCRKRADGTAAQFGSFAGLFHELRTPTDPHSN